jgi:hypothetical protein
LPAFFCSIGFARVAVEAPPVARDRNVPQSLEARSGDCASAGNGLG